MSYPSVKLIVKEKNINLNSATDAELKEVLWMALEKDLADGIAYLKNQAEEVRVSGARVLKTENPSSPLGQQIIRLLGTDVARALCSEKLGVAFGFYNCCNPVAAPSNSTLKLSIQEQIMLQNGEMSYANC